MQSQIPSQFVGKFLFLDIKPRTHDSFNWEVDLTHEIGHLYFHNNILKRNRSDRLTKISKDLDRYGQYIWSKNLSPILKGKSCKTGEVCHAQVSSLLPDLKSFISISDQQFFKRHFRKYHELFADFFASVYFGSPTTMEASSHFSPERGFEVSTPTRSYNAYYYFAPTRRELWQDCALSERSKEEIFDQFLQAIYQNAKWEVDEEIQIISQKDDIITQLYLNARKACL